MKINFYTTSTLSDVGNISSKLIKKIFPDSKHFIIDGRKGWFKVWYKWLDIANESDADWHVHLDEDCFITSGDSITNLIDYMAINKLNIAGMPDGYNKYRRANHIALNSFFMIMDNISVKTWVNRNRDNLPQFKKEWIIPYPFNHENDSNYIYSNVVFGSDKNYSNQWTQFTEPYYDFMWVLKEGGCNFHYLEPYFDSKYQSTNLLNNTIIHMWFQRQRNIDEIISPIHTLTNKKRFDLIITDMETILIK